MFTVYGDVLFLASAVVQIGGGVAGIAAHTTGIPHLLVIYMVEVAVREVLMLLLLVYASLMPTSPYTYVVDSCIQLILGVRTVS